jgi:hypothetical protein
VGESLGQYEQRHNSRLTPATLIEVLLIIRCGFNTVKESYLRKYKTDREDLE